MALSWFLSVACSDFDRNFQEICMEAMWLSAMKMACRGGACPTLFEKERIPETKGGASPTLFEKQRIPETKGRASPTPTGRFHPRWCAGGACCLSGIRA